MTLQHRTGTTEHFGLLGTYLLGNSDNTGVRRPLKLLTKLQQLQVCDHCRSDCKSLHKI